MSISSLLTKLLYELSEKNYDNTFSVYRLWIEIHAAHGGTPNDKLYYDILNSIRPELIQATLTDVAPQSSASERPDWVNPFVRQPTTYKWTPEDDARFSGNLIHDGIPLLLRFIADAEQDPVFSKHTIRLRDRLCRSSLEGFFEQSISYLPGGGGYPRSKDFCQFYTKVNLVAHWINLGCAQLEDVRDRILQSLTFQPTVYPHQLNALMILLKISGATFAAYADPSIMDRCCDLLKTCEDGSKVADKLAKEILQLREDGWKGLPPPPTLRCSAPHATVPKPQDPAATPVATSLGLPSMVEQPQSPALPSPALDLPSDNSPGSPAPSSPSTSIATLSDFTIADSPDDESTSEPDTIMPHDTFYLEDGSVEVVCGKTLFRIHSSTLSFHSPVLRKMFSSANLAAAESPNGCPRIVSSDSPIDFATLLKIVYLPEFQDRTRIPDFSTFSSLLRVSSKYEIPNLRARLLKTVRDAYPETFEGLDPSKVLGENVFDGPKPHPNTVLNLFIQQKVTSALPMAYYMAARRGSDSLMDTQLPSSATLSGQTLRFAIRGLIALREMELKETHHIVFATKNTTELVGCSSAECLSRSSKSTLGGDDGSARQRIFDQITGPVNEGTRILQVLSATEFAEGPGSKFCQVCAEKMQAAHAEVRRKAWAALPEVFGLRE